MKKAELFFAFILLPVDIAMVIASFIVSYALRQHLEISNSQFSANLTDYIRLSIYFIPFVILIFALSNLYNTRLSKGLAREFLQIIISYSGAMLALVMILFFSKTSYFSRLILIFIWLTGIVFLSLGRVIIELIQQSLLKYGIGRHNVLIIGANETTRFIINEIKNNQRIGFKVAGVINITDSRVDGMKIIGGFDDISAIVKDKSIDEIILTDGTFSKTKTAELIDICAEHRINFKFVPDILAQMSLNVGAESIGSMPVLSVRTNPLDGWGRIFKRVFDVAASLVILIVLLPVVLLIVIIQLITSPGPIIYVHERVGRDGNKFKLSKFRSMYPDSEHNEGRYWTSEKDDRITPFGRFLRKTNLDEIPQLLNILKGDMSFIGPRPEQPRFVEQFSREIPGYYQRHRVKSGLTGWAQVNGLKGDTSIVERVRYDMYYIENWSILFDLKIFFRTLYLIFYELFKGKYEYRADS